LLTFFVYTLKARVYTEKVQETRELLGSAGTDHVQVQIFVQIQMEAIVFIFLEILFVARAMLSKLGNHSYFPVLAEVIRSMCDAFRPVACKRK